MVRKFSPDDSQEGPEVSGGGLGSEPTFWEPSAGPSDIAGMLAEAQDKYPEIF